MRTDKKRQGGDTGEGFGRIAEDFRLFWAHRLETLVDSYAEGSNMATLSLNVGVDATLSTVCKLKGFQRYYIYIYLGLHKYAFFRLFNQNRFFKQTPTILY